MKLIDKDKLYDDGYILTHQAVWPVIEKQEVIKAIPIEWLCSKYLDITSKSWSSGIRLVLNKVIDDWVKENV